MIVRGKDLIGPVRETADVVIVGSGCGGGASAKVLAQAGKRVAVLEEGGAYAPSDFDGSEQSAYQNLYRRRAGQTTEDLAVTVLQGRCVGGSSTVNWMTSLRTPEFTLKAWRRELGIDGWSYADLEPYFERVERYLQVAPETDSRHNGNNRILLEGARALGYRVRTTSRNARECVQAGLCGLGCPFGAKLSVDTTYIPDAVKAGAQVYADCRAEKIELHGRTKRVHARVVSGPAPGPEVILEAPVVIVSASAIYSPVLLLRSGLGNASNHVGRNLTFHLTTAVIGEYERFIDPGSGIPQSVMCDEFLNRQGDGSGFWIEAVPVYPALAGLSLPAFGKVHRQFMEGFRHLGALIVLVKETDSSGTVRANSRGGAVIKYEQGPRDREVLRQAVGEAAKIQFAAGARSVITLHARLTRITSPAEIDDILEDASWGPNHLSLFSAHPLGTCRMSRDPHAGVVDARCQTHDVRGLFVVDGSITPSSLGVNPQLTLLAMAEKASEWIAENHHRISAGS
jgi:choline dehydrogenase-like flavoprotein